MWGDIGTETTRAFNPIPQAGSECNEDRGSNGDDASATDPRLRYTQTAAWEDWLSTRLVRGCCAGLATIEHRLKPLPDRFDHRGELGLLQVRHTEMNVLQRNDEFPQDLKRLIDPFHLVREPPESRD